MNQMAQTTTQPDAQARWSGAVHAVADPMRLRLLRLLERHELGVAELVDVLQAPQSTVSRHLKLLADEAWLVCRRDGTNNLYRMILDELDEHARQLWVLARRQTDAWPAFAQDELRLTERLRQRGDARAFFAGAAAQWTRTRERMYGCSFDRHALLALLPGDWTVADLGCGAGVMARDLAARAGKVIGVDNSPQMLDAARKLTETCDNVELRVGELGAIPIDNGACDAALLVLVLTYVDEPGGALGEMARILRKGGRAVVVDLMRHNRDDFRREMGQRSMGFEMDELAKLMSSAGFAGVDCRALPPEPNAKGPALLLACGEKA